MATMTDSIPAPTISITKAQNTLTLDGHLDESEWAKAEIATNFFIQSPIDGKPASKVTEVKLSFTDQHLFIGAKCFDDDDYIIQTLKRDNFGDSDEFAVLIDPVGEKATGFGFGVNAMGALTEVLISNDDVDDSWNNKWDAKVQRFSDYWTVEIAIPFRTLRYKSGKKEWGINFGRVDPGTNEVSVWSPVPRQFDFTELAFFGTLNWDNAPQKTGSNIAIIPYVTARHDQLAAEGDFSFDAGGDAKVAITPTLNLDLTYNPDFSQVEVDAQVTNLTRFSIFFPERRQFFLENADIFSQYGQFADRPFFSRTIGLNASRETVPILYGGRLSGNISNKLRVGLLNMHTKGDSLNAGQNYSAVSFQQRLGQRSAIKGIFLNRQAFDGVELVEKNYGRNLGGEIVLSTPDGKWQGNLGFINSMKDGFSNKNNYTYGLARYNGTNFRTFLAIRNMQENYFADMGFNGRLYNFDPVNNQSVRIGFTQITNMMDYYFYPQASEKVNYHWSGIENFVYLNPDGSINEWYTRLRHFIFYKNTAQLRFRLNNNYINLIYPFALTTPFIPVDEYSNREFNIQFNTDIRKKLNTEMFIVYGSFYLGNKLTYRGSISYRVQPWGNFSLGLERNDIWFPDPYQDVSFTLATVRAEINFSTNLFWTTFLQYNTQRDNFNINSRLQWRYAPMSDLFLVYTDNYAVEGMFGHKSRSIVVKMNYWLTL